MSCPHRFDTAAYVLGALDPDDRERFEAHLRTGCAECRAAVGELAPMPGLLAHASADDLLESAPAPPGGLLPSLVDRVRRTRRRSRLRTATAAVAAAACLAAAAFAAGALLRPAPPPATPAPSPSAVAAPAVFEPVGGVDMWGAATLVERPEGTRIELDCVYNSRYDYGDATTGYVLTVVRADGSTERAGSWDARDAEQAEVTLFTRGKPEDVVAMEIRDLDGRLVLRWPSG
ncbi:anti-sigma factor family protein [Allonocardiopsis opalescens]|uniref:Uncharacterized protein n=1 Tax=Allonocardiopsis opalescens TaxID=1144618 RepID=A0A2T0QAF8_9ACTN|nr:zf-HC2 domain-containing protein [Allonocardiopsis opalescens]PRY00834.1 hypothetical protein CLV72_102466 [Allonocardiopsis opalescens]